MSSHCAYADLAEGGGDPRDVAHARRDGQEALPAVVRGEREVGDDPHERGEDPADRGRAGRPGIPRAGLQRVVDQDPGLPEVEHGLGDVEHAGRHGGLGGFRDLLLHQGGLPVGADLQHRHGAARPREAGAVRGRREPPQRVEHAEVALDLRLHRERLQLDPHASREELPGPRARLRRGRGWRPDARAAPGQQRQGQRGAEGPRDGSDWRLITIINIINIITIINIMSITIIVIMITIIITITIMVIIIIMLILHICIDVYTYTLLLLLLFASFNYCC